MASSCNYKAKYVQKVDHLKKVLNRKHLIFTSMKISYRVLPKKVAPVLRHVTSIRKVVCSNTHRDNKLVGTKISVTRFRPHPFYLPLPLRGTAVAQWLRCCATNRKVAGLIPDAVIGIFH